jgi:hypothetical protein
MKKRALVIMLLCLAASAGAQELLEAVKTGDLDKVRLIVERNPGVVNVPNQNGETILFAAIVPGGRPEIAAYSHLDWLGPDSWIRTVARGLKPSAGK